MKKIVFFALFAFSQIFAQRVLTIDEAILENVTHLSQRLPARTNVLFLNIEAQSVNLSDYILDEMKISVINNTRLTAADKRNLPNILQSMGVRDINEIDESAKLQIAQQLGAAAVVTGSISQLGENFRFRVQTLNAADGRVLGLQSFNVRRDEILTDLLAASGAQTDSREAARARLDAQIQEFSTVNQTPPPSLV